MKSWTITIEEDPKTKDLMLPFTSEILSAIGWEEGDVIVWKRNKNGTWTLKKKIDKKPKKSV